MKNLTAFSTSASQKSVFRYFIWFSKLNYFSTFERVKLKFGSLNQDWTKNLIEFWHCYEKTSFDNLFNLLGQHWPLRRRNSQMRAEIGSHQKFNVIFEMSDPRNINFDTLCVNFDVKSVLSILGPTFRFWIQFGAGSKIGCDIQN